MASQTSKNSIIIPKPLLKKSGVVVLSLEEYERMKEDFEMLQSKKLAKEIQKARKEAKKRKVITLEELERKLNL